MPKSRSGQVILGLIISLGILSILSGVVITLVTSAYRIISFTSARTRAKFLATETIETIRNLPFDQVGTVAGIPSGVIPQQQSAHINGQNFVITTTIIYIDDTFDGVAPTDALPIDYKRIRVQVSWDGLGRDEGNKISLISDLAPRGTENISGAGTLSVFVFNAQGLPVSQANVHIVASSVNPPVDLDIQTGDDGRVILPGALTCNSCYQITVTKDGYSSERTYSTNEVATPAKSHQTILESQLTQISFAIDRVSAMTVFSTTGRETGFTALPNQSFTIRGDKTIGTDGVDDPVYKFNETVTTNSSGQITFENLEWDNYYITALNSSYDTSGKSPLEPITVLPDTSLEAKFASVSHTTNTYRAIFTDPASNPVASVTAQLSLSGQPVATVSSGLAQDPDFGQSFFEDLTAESYQISATAAGYLDYSNTVNMSGQKVEQIILTPQ